VKKSLVAFLLASMIVLSFAVPAMAADVVVTEPVSVVYEQEISPRHEFTRTYWRTYGGVLQMRVWSITNGRWLTDWIDF